MTRRRVVIEEPVSLSLGRYLDDPAGLRQVLEAIDALAEDPRPPARLGALGAGDEPTARRLIPVLYEIGETTIWVRRVDRIL